MWSVLDGELGITALARYTNMKQRILIMCFGIVQQRRKCGCILPYLINNTIFSLGLYRIA
ncbi:hypothetical protein Gohar_018349 [Gossypium harknessii]|uniref:Uncharacterized protein n=1 Tax=Gossypium harknessii TaxID=34285 RepID=A0A7J9G9H4_9ROSI|nr:hypothetical protein [Gossypium harknessii]